MLKRTPQGMYHDPGRTVYHILSIGKQPDSSKVEIPRKNIETILDLYLSLSFNLASVPPYHAQYQVVVLLTWSRG